MIGELCARIDNLIAVVDLGEPFAPARDEIVEYLDETVFPHAAAEETTIYRAGAKTEHRLIESLKREHGQLRVLRNSLRTAKRGAEAVSFAGAIGHLFNHHAGVENDFVLPAVLENTDNDLGKLLHEMHGEFTEKTKPRPERECDVRPIPHASRHDEIFSCLNTLSVSESLVLVNDHDPAPLRYQLDAMWPGVYSWSYRQKGPEVWKVSIARVAAPAAEAV